MLKIFLWTKPRSLLFCWGWKTRRVTWNSSPLIFGRIIDWRRPTIPVRKVRKIYISILTDIHFHNKSSWIENFSFYFYLFVKVFIIQSPLFCLAKYFTTWGRSVQVHEDLAQVEPLNLLVKPSLGRGRHPPWTSSPGTASTRFGSGTSSWRWRGSWWKPESFAAGPDVETRRFQNFFTFLKRRDRDVLVDEVDTTYVNPS